MARVNVGVNPLFLADQHLIAESVEITMISGALRKNNFLIKSEVPTAYALGKGHINFFKPRLAYLKARLAAVNSEMRRRGFNPGTELLLEEFPERFWGTYKPTFRDSCIVRQRIAERLTTRLAGQPGDEFYRYSGTLIGNRLPKFIDNLKKSKLFEL